MAGRLFLCVAILGLMAVGAPVASACDAGAILSAESYATVYIGTVQVTVAEFMPYEVCASGIGPAAPSARLRITDGNTVLCNRTDVDPGFDPFFFGAGIHNAPEDPCGADITWASITNPPLPSEVSADPEERSAFVGVLKSAPADGPYWSPGGSGVVPEGTEGFVIRGVRVRVVAA